MPKHKRKIRGSLIISLIAVLLLLTLILGYIFLNAPKENSKGTSQQQSELLQIAESVTLDSELVKVAVLGDILKIDCITPGLDDYSMRIVIYDMKQKKILSEKDFESASWVSGLTDNGFYTVNVNEKHLSVYDLKGNCTNELSFADNVKWSSACSLSEDGDTFLYTDITNGNIFLYDMNSGTTNTLSRTDFYCNDATFYNGRFYLTDLDSELISVEAKSGEYRTELIDPEMQHIAPPYAIKTTDYNFGVFDVTVGKMLYLPITSIDEGIIGVGNWGFVTSVTKNTGTLLSAYNMQTKIKSKLSIEDNVESVCLLDDGTLLIVAKSSKDNTHKLYIARFGDKDFFKYSSKDIPLSQQTVQNTVESVNTDGAIMVENVPVISQFPKYPTGCESVSAQMVLQFFGENITTDEFIDNYLNRSTEFYTDGGVRYGPSPWEYFIGNPRSSASYGCMAPVIEEALSEYFGTKERVLNATGKDLQTLCERYIDNGIPVMVWATINMLDTQPVNTWYLSDGKRFTWPGNEHCIVLVGYDSQYYYFNDPYVGATVRYEKQLAEAHYAELGSQSVVILPKNYSAKSTN